MTTRQRYNNYRSEELGISSEELGIKETQNYTYDENGNLIYVNVERLRDDGKQTEKIKERKLRWDEENRLMAIDDNGFISNYWYDYAGERVVKEAGGNEGVFVNSVFSGGRTDNSTFTLYVSPYMVVSQGGHYTKHYYIGGERVVSKLGDLDSYGADPRRIEYAGEDVDKVSVDYVLKYKDAQQTVKDNYKDFKVPYLGLDNDDYINGEGFCCTDKTTGFTALDSNIGNGNDDPEKLIFFYHSDHLGSTSYVTNLDGEITQHVEYIPFGEVFLEERNNVWNTPYLFNGKELDEETGLYYYGARYYNPRESVWLSVDPLAEKYPGVSPYAYCFNNPVNFIDPLGLEGEDPPIKKVVEYKTNRGNPATIYKQGGLINYRGRSDTDTDGAGDSYKSDKTGQGATSIKGGGGVFKNAGKNGDVDPDKISYTVTPLGNPGKRLKEEGVGLGDVAYSLNLETNKDTYSIVADRGPANKLGENSTYANKKMGLADASGKKGIDANSVITIIFPGSRKLFLNSTDTEINTGGAIPNQDQIKAAGQYLYNQNKSTINSIINNLKDEKRVVS
jgi:RHS repeat-associated protein